MAKTFTMLLAASSMLMTACGGSSTSAARSVGQCDVVIDRWFEIQQDFLDQLAELEATDATEAQRTGVFSGTAAGIFENGRDAITLGCETAIESGSAELCSRIDELNADPGEAALALAEIEENCA